MKSLTYGKQLITEDDIESVVRILKSDYLTQGPEVLKFEKNFASYVNSKYAVAVSNGTAALHLSAIVMNVNSNDKVITSPITFAASANCVKFCGGEVIFSDIDPNSYLIDLNKLEKLLKRKNKGYYKGIIAIDFAGRSIDYENLKNLADKYGCWIIEDACHSPGGYFINSKNINENCGNGKYADVSIFSFHPVKHIACGEGGMITTNNKTIYERLLKLRSHGITKNHKEFTNSSEIYSTSINYPGWYMEMQELGYNYRLTDIQAALGNSQLKKASLGIEKRKKIASLYYKEFKNNPNILRQSGVVEGHAYHLYIIEVKERLKLYEFLKENKIFTQIHYYPCHLMPYYRRLGWKKGDFPNAEKYYEKCLSLPMYPSLEISDQQYVIRKILEFFN